ncbi:AbiJ-NTD4 domain-containing protein [Rhizobium ruizarguesonis]
MHLDRTQITFGQAEGTSPLPSQQQLKSVSPETRAALWVVIYESLYFYNRSISGEWAVILRDWHVTREFRAIDDFSGGYASVVPKLKDLFFNGSYVEIFDFLQFSIRHQKRPHRLAETTAYILTKTKAAYRLEGKTFFPVQSEEDAATVSRAFRDAADHRGALQHLKNSAEAATTGAWAESITQSVHAVEAISKLLAPGTNTLRPALDELEKHHKIHGALKNGFLRIYDFTSDEKGLRHSLLDKEASDVDESDALFMLGACSAFVSYLVAKARAADLPIDQNDIS